MQEIGPAVLSELNDCGIKKFIIRCDFLIWFSLEDSGKLVEIISKMAKFHKSKFSIKLGIHNWIETTMRFDSKCMECKEPMPEGTGGLWLRGQGVKHIQCVSMYVPLLPASTIFTNEDSGIVFDDRPNDRVDFETRKQMREALRG